MLIRLLLSLFLLALRGSAPVTVLSIGTTRIVLDSTELVAARAALGSAPTNESGDASTSDHWLCYTVQDRSYRLRLESLEMNGPSIGAFWLGPATADTARSNCAPTSHTLGSIKTDRGIAIGIARNAVHRVLGTPTRHSVEWDEFEYHHESLYSTFRVHYRKNVVTIIEGNVFHAG